VDNLRDGETLRYPIAFLRGATDQTGAFTVANRTNARASGKYETTVVDGRFKALVELVPGRNTVNLKCGSSATTLRITYKPMTTAYKMNVVYVLAEDGNTAYETPYPTDPQNYADKLDTIAKLMQTFTAERMNDTGFGRKTFNLEFDKSGKVVVHAVKYPASVDVLRSKDGNALWGMFYGWLDKQFPMDRNKNLVVMAFTHYDPATKKASAHTALGGGGEGLFGSSDMFSWPGSIREVERVFTDAAIVDDTKVHDDSAFRSTMWGLAGTTIGAMMHEMGHTFDLPHSSDGESVMSRGFDHFNRFFTLVEPPRKGQTEPTHFKDNQIAYWDAYYAAQMNSSRWFEPDKREYQPDKPPTVDINVETKQVTISAEYGLAMVGFNTGKDDVEKRTYETYGDATHKTKVFALPDIRAKLGSNDPLTVLAMDTQGTLVQVREAQRKADH